jgi:predicted RNA-binding Zn ribbon-like protein
VPAPLASADGGPPAPGPLRLVQSLANTQSLGTREDAAAWLSSADLLPDGSALSNSEHAALLRLRESLRDLLAARTSGRQDDDAAARLTRALADGRVVVTVDPPGGIRLASAARASYSSLVAAVAVAIAESAAAGTWPMLKSCSAAGCGVAFYDGSDPAAATRCSAHAGPEDGA